MTSWLVKMAISGNKTYEELLKMIDIITKLLLPIVPAFKIKHELKLELKYVLEITI